MLEVGGVLYQPLKVFPRIDQVTREMLMISLMKRMSVERTSEYRDAGRGSCSQVLTNLEQMNFTLSRIRKTKKIRNCI